MNNTFFYGQNKKLNTTKEVVLEFTINLANPGMEFSLPGDYTGIYNFDVDWGDGNYAEGIISYDQAEARHNYSNAGEYNIKIYGLFSSVRSGETYTSDAYITKIGGTCENIQNVYLNNLSNLVEVNSGFMSKFTSQYANEMFSNCTSLNILPDDYLSNNTTIMSATYMFGGCTSLETIPENFLKNNSMRLVNYMFKGCANLRYVSKDFLTNSTTLIECTSTFINCSKLEVAPDLTTKTQVTHHNDCYKGCVVLPEYPYYPTDWGGLGQKKIYELEFMLNIPSNSTNISLPLVISGTYDFVVNWGDGTENTIKTYNDPNITHTYLNSGDYHLTIKGTCTEFSGNGIKEYVTEIGGEGRTLTSLRLDSYTKLTTIQKDFLNKGTNLTNLSSLFNKCSSLITIPEGFLDKCINLTSISGMFSSCTSLETIPIGFLDKNVKINNCYGMFMHCSSLREIPADFLKNNTLISNISSFFTNCTSLTTVPETFMMTYTHKPSYVGNTFSGCINLTTAPNFSTVVPTISTHSSCYKGCTKLSFYNSLPNDWK